MVRKSMDVVAWLRKQLEEADPDLLRAMVSAFVDALMGAEVDDMQRRIQRAHTGPGQLPQRLSDARVGHARRLDRAPHPKLRQGTYFPDWLVEPRRRAEQALIAVVADCYLAGVSTRRVDKLVKTLGIDGISKSQVSRLAQSLDDVVEQFRSRPLDAGPYTYLWIDALVVKCRDGGRVVNVVATIATAVNSDGYREVLRIDVSTSEDGAAWLAFLRGLKARGLAGIKLVVSDSHEGLKDAIATVLDGATWQRCRTHFMRNLLNKVPKSAQNFVATLVRSIFAQPDHDAVWAQHARVVEQL